MHFAMLLRFLTGRSEFKKKKFNCIYECLESDILGVGINIEGRGWNNSKTSTWGAIIISAPC